MKFSLSKSVISLVICTAMLAGCFPVVSLAASSEASEPVLSCTFEDGSPSSVSEGEITDYGDSRALKLTVDEAGTSLSFESLVVGEAVISFDMAAEAGSMIGEIGIQGGGTPGSLMKFTEKGKVLTYNSKNVCGYSSKMKNIAMVIDASKKRFDVYVDGKLVVYRCYLDVMFDKLVSFDMTFAAREGTADIYIDNLMVYPSYIKTAGGKIYRPENIPSDANKVVKLTQQNYFPSDYEQRKLLTGRVTLHMRSGVLYANGEKILLDNLPYYSDDDSSEYMVPSEVLEKGLGREVTEQDGVIRVGEGIVLSVGQKEMTVGSANTVISAAPEMKDGILYLPLRAIAEKALGKQCYYDSTSVHSGMIVITDSDFVMPKDDALQALNDFCFYFRPDKELILADYNASPLKGQHPRLMADAEDFERIKEEVKTNPRKKNWYERLIAYCDNTLMNVETVRYELRDGVRLLYVSDEFSRYTTCLAMAYKLTGDRKYFDSAWRHIEAVANMPDWNPSHHIDVGTMAQGYAIAYDWFYDIMTDEQKEIMERGAYNNLFYTVNLAIQSDDTAYGTVLHVNNHNVYCNAGIMATCMAFMDVYPDIASKISADVIRMLEYFMDKFAPMGAYYEGAAYATVAINFTTRLFAAMYPILGTLYGLDKAEGFNLSADYMTNVQSDVSAFNFADGDYGLVKASGCFWLYDYYDITGLKDGVADGTFYAPSSEDNVYCLLWYDTSEEEASAASKLDIHYSGQEIITMRNTFEPGQVFVGIKAGDTDYEHSHLDSGSFVFDAQGKRWAFDLGKDDYNLGYKYSHWDIFRRRAESHNTLLINPSAAPGYVVGSRADVISYESKEKGVITKINMTELYGTDVIGARRGYFFTDDRRSLVVRDEVTLSQKSDLYWLMYIDSEAEIVDNNTVILSDKTNPDRKLKVEFASSTPGEIGVEDARPFPASPQIPEQDKNVGYYRLYYKVSTAGNVNITAKLTPYDYVGTSIDEYNVSMDQWIIPDGKLKDIPELDSLTVDGESYDVKDRYITVTVPNEESAVPVIAAESSRYEVKIKQAASLDDTASIVLSDPDDSANSVTYSINFTPKVKKRVFEGYTVLEMNNVTASSEPQAENPKEHVLDGKLDTRWSSENKQWLCFDLESAQSFDTLFLAMYLGDTRYSEFTVEISDDGTNFTQIGKFTTSGTTADYEAFELGEQTARYVKINFSGASTTSWNSPTEIAVADKK